MKASEDKMARLEQGNQPIEGEQNFQSEVLSPQEIEAIREKVRKEYEQNPPQLTPEEEEEIRAKVRDDFNK